ncbi:MAG TPA: ROK family protein [Bryobacteraceae bacterium]|nr:ROK family protein [Bryobacteraceae bacterium]
MSTLAIDVGGTKFTMAVFSEGRMLDRETRRTDRGGGRDWMLDQITQIGREWRRLYRFEQCGIGFGGPVLYELQRVALSTHVGGWQDFHLPNYVKNVLGVGAVMDNDANVGGLGELTYGAGRGMSNIFYMTLSTGIGGGILVDGSIYRGADSYAGELGHMTLVPDGPDCLCGSRGCFERMCSGLWLERDYGKSAELLMQDPEFVRKYVVHLAMGLKTVLMLLNPERIVIGGGISKAGEALFGPLREELGRQMTAWSRARVDVVPAILGDDSVLWGALALAEQV